MIVDGQRQPKAPPAPLTLRDVFVQPLPVPLVMESNDEATWSLWDRIVEAQERALEHERAVRLGL